MAGRKPSLTPQAWKIIKDCLEKGFTREMAAAKAGMHVSTFQKYQAENKEFSEMVHTALQFAHEKAVEAFRSGLEDAKEYKVTERTFKETRLDGEGKPFVYAETTTTKETTTRAKDWRAGAEWLKRRDPKNWADRLIVDFNLDIELVYKLAQEIAALGDDPKEWVKEVTQELQNERLLASRN